MKNYKQAEKSFWEGRKSNDQLYLHERVRLETLENLVPTNGKKKLALLGYVCDEGVRRNKGRVGASKGPDAIRKQLGKLPNHLAIDKQLVDIGNLSCDGENLEELQTKVIETVGALIRAGMFPILLGGGHDLAYAHFMGLRNNTATEKTIGIINFDAHFDMRSNEAGNNSGTPFYQIALDLKKQEAPFKYFCVGIRKDANDAKLFKIAEEYGTIYLERNYFSMSYLEHVQLRIMQFLEDVDLVYTTIDMDGFSSAYAPGVSAASPMGFSPDIVLESLKLILESGKLVGLDVVELNPDFDIDNATSKLAASLLHYVIHSL